MNARHMVEVREMFMGEELVYYVQLIDPCPEPADLNPYGEQGRCFVKPESPARPVATAPTVAKRVPSKAEYVRSFAGSGALPECVLAYRVEVENRIARIVKRFRVTSRRMNARLFKALDWYDVLDLACVYDTGRLVRIEHLYADQRQRLARSLVSA